MHKIYVTALHVMANGGLFISPDSSVRSVHVQDRVHRIEVTKRRLCTGQ